MMNNDRTGGYAVAKALRDSGIDLVFGIPGTHNLEIYRYLESLGIGHVSPRHEQGGGYAADAYARVSQKPGVLITTSGPGLTNACTPAATAYADSVPVLIVSPGVPRGMEGADAGLLHEVKHQQRHLDSIVDRSIRVCSAEHAYYSITETVNGWWNRRPRPVHVEIPVDVLEGPLGSAALNPPPPPASPSAPATSAIPAAAEALSGSQNTVVVAGGGSRRAAPALQRLVEVSRAVLVTTVNGKGAVPETHPQSLGACIRLPEAQRLINEAAAVVVVGSELGDSDLWGGELRPSGTVIRIDIDAAQLQKNVAAQIPIRGDAAAVLADLADHLERLAPPAPLESDLTDVRAALEAAALRDGAPWQAYHRALTSVLPRDTIVAGDSAQVSYFGTVHQWPMGFAGQFVYPAGYATLGYGIPAAIGAKVARPEQTVMALIGDGGAMFTIQEFVTAVELALPLPVVVMNNGGYGEIRDEMRARGITPAAVDIRPPDFAALGRAFGGAGAHVRSPEELAEAVLGALDRSGPTLIEVEVP